MIAGSDQEKTLDNNEYINRARLMTGGWYRLLASANFGGLVLGCINADFCVQILILQRFSRSTRLSHLCTARNSKSSQIFVKLFSYFQKFVLFDPERFSRTFHLWTKARPAMAPPDGPPAGPMQEILRRAEKELGAHARGYD